MSERENVIVKHRAGTAEGSFLTTMTQDEISKKCIAMSRNNAMRKCILIYVYVFFKTLQNKTKHKQNNSKFDVI